MKHIAVIGTGVAGLTAAWLLSRRHRVTVFEEAPRAGGHAHTHRLTVDDRQVDVDTGFIVFNDRNYPTFNRLLERLELPGRATDMSFSVSDAASGLEYNGSSLDGLFAQRRNLARPRFWAMLGEILRFNRLAPRLLQLAGPGPTLDGFLAEAGFGRDFSDHYLRPMTGAIWSVPNGELGTFPAKRIIEFLANHGLLSLRDRPQWFVIPGGSARYVERLVADLDDLRLGCAVRAVHRRSGGVTVTTDHGTSDFDEVVLAVHSDQALTLLADASCAEREVLGAIRFQTNDVLLHSDSVVMPAARRAWASWNYHVPADGGDQVTVSYWMNHLQHLETDTQLFVSLNQDARIAPQRVLARMRYSHPIFDPPAVAAQAQRDRINGQHHTWFCGAWWRYGFHEDGCLSGAEVAAAWDVAL